MLLGSSDAQGIATMPTGGFIVRPRAYRTTLRMICDTGRARLRSNRPSLDTRMISWDDGTPWQVAMRLERPAPEQYQLVGELLRDETVRPLSDANWIHESGLVLFGESLSRLDSDQVWPLVQKLWTAGEFELGDDPSAFLAEYHALPNMPRLSLPAGEMHIESDAAPVPMVRITSGAGSWRASRRRGCTAQKRAASRAARRTGPTPSASASCACAIVQLCSSCQAALASYSVAYRLCAVGGRGVGGGEGA